MSDKILKRSHVESDSGNGEEGKRRKCDIRNELFSMEELQKESLSNKTGVVGSFDKLLGQPLRDFNLQYALDKFRMTSSEEIEKLTKLNGLDFRSAANALVEKLRGSHCDPFNPDPDEVNVVMKLAGFSTQEDAVRALIVKEELVKLRRQGLPALEAIDELIKRMKVLIGGKRKAFDSLSISEKMPSTTTIIPSKSTSSILDYIRTTRKNENSEVPSHFSIDNTQNNLYLQTQNHHTWQSNCFSLEETCSTSRNDNINDSENVQCSYERKRLHAFPEERDALLKIKSSNEEQCEKTTLEKEIREKNGAIYHNKNSRKNFLRSFSKQNNAIIVNYEDDLDATETDDDYKNEQHKRDIQTHPHFEWNANTLLYSPFASNSTSSNCNFPSSFTNSALQQNTTVSNSSEESNPSNHLSASQIQNMNKDNQMESFLDFSVSMSNSGENGYPDNIHRILQQQQPILPSITSISHQLSSSPASSYAKDLLVTTSTEQKKRRVLLPSTFESPSKKMKQYGNYS